MYDLAWIDRTNLEAFRPLITPSALELVDYMMAKGLDNQLLMLGVLADGAPFSVIVCALDSDEGYADILSLFVRHDYRRKGFATDLVGCIASLLSQREEGYILRCDVTQREIVADGTCDGGKELSALFHYLEFQEQEREEIGCFCCTLQELESNPVLNKTFSKTSIKRLSELTVHEKRSLMDEQNDALLEGIKRGLYEPNLSLAYTENDSVKAIVAVGCVGNDLVLKWARVDQDKQIMLIVLLGAALQNARAKWSKDTRVYLPYINARSRELIQKMLGPDVVPCEKQFTYFYALTD